MDTRKQVHNQEDKKARSLHPKAEEKESFKRAKYSKQSQNTTEKKEERN